MTMMPAIVWKAVVNVARTRLAGLMCPPSLRLRLQAITTNACRTVQIDAITMLQMVITTPVDDLASRA